MVYAVKNLRSPVTRRRVTGKAQTFHRPSAGQAIRSQPTEIPTQPIGRRYRSPPHREPVFSAQTRRNRCKLDLILVNQMSEKMLRKIELGPRSAFPVRNSPEFPLKGLGIDDLGTLRSKRRLRRTLHPARSAAVEKKSFSSWRRTGRLNS